jgi:hypothetical protein
MARFKKVSMVESFIEIDDPEELAEFLQSFASSGFGGSAAEYFWSIDGEVVGEQLFFLDGDDAREILDGDDAREILDNHTKTVRRELADKFGFNPWGS